MLITLIITLIVLWMIFNHCNICSRRITFTDRIHGGTAKNNWLCSKFPVCKSCKQKYPEEVS